MQRNTAKTRRAALSLLAAGAVVTGLLAGSNPASAAPPDGPTRMTKPVTFKDGRYIVVLRQPGASSLKGSGARGAGGQLDGRSVAVREYARTLRANQRTVAGSVGADVAHSYTMALNGFAARLSGKQAGQLAGDRRVLLVQPDTARHVDTWNTPDFLGLTGTWGAWTRTGGPSEAGAGVVVGVLDTGIWPESASFEGASLARRNKTEWDIHRIGSRTYMDKADGNRFQGECETGDGWELSDCNTKLIGARYYPDIFAGVTDPSPEEWMSPRDGEGHGTHTAGTAAGNHGVRAMVEGRRFGRISGMAPAARIAAYKVCYADNDPGTGDCYGSASLAAIDDAIVDGVDVINYSISGASDTVIDAVELGFEGAAEAGIFVAASAGNSGPDESTVNHPGPWLTTVAASTHTAFENTVLLGNGQKLVGASINSSDLSSHKLVNSEDVPDSGADAADARLCLPDSLDPAGVTGKIVVCTRGTNARVEKSATVKAAGGVGMILVNPSENSLDADFHSVPTVHLDDVAGAKLLSYMGAAGASAKASFSAGNLTKKRTPIPQIAGFSSRGPSLANDSDIIKPDISAPGVSVLAAVAPPTNEGRKFDLYSGTSMASPHIAGLGAFLASVHPDWTPMQLKSAMMTSTRNLLTPTGKQFRDPFAQGAGNVRPKRFLDPGLMVTSNARDWLGYITGQGLDTGVAAIEAKDLNQPSMAQGQVVGEAVFTRRFVSTMKGKWTVHIKVPGFQASANRSAVVMNRKRDIEDLWFTFTRTTAPLNEWATGYVVLSGPTKVRMPVALRPVAVAAPSDVSGVGTDGSTPVEITAGSTGDLAVTVSGLAQADTATDTVDTGDQHYYCVQASDTAKALRVNLDAVKDTADLDLYAYVMSGDCNSSAIAYLAIAATGAADETFTVAAPDAGSYIIEVDGYAAAPGDTSTDYILDIFNVDATTTLGALAADPNPVPVVAGETTSFDAVWSGLDPASKYLGVFEYDGATPTYLSVTTP